MLFGLVALTPSALATSPPGVAQTVVVSVCRGTETGVKVRIPLHQAPAEPGTDGDCHPKGCHAAGSRKRAACHI